MSCSIDVSQIFASSAASTLLPLLATYFITTLLALLPGTVFWRRVLLPLTLWFALRTALLLDASGGNPARAHANQSLAMFMQTISVRCVVWAIDSAQVKPLPGTPAEKNAERASWDALLLNALDLALGPRELSWQGPSMPKALRRTPLPQRRTVFLRRRMLSLVLHIILADLLQVALQSFSPELSTPVGGSVFDPSLPPLRRYIRSTAMSLLFGSTIYATTHAVYDALSVLGVFILRQSPSQWPPLFNSPWRATSLRELWGDRWHQMNRRWMINLGAKPAYRLVGSVGGVLAPFALSGLVHDISLRNVGRGSDFAAVFGFFFMMGVGVLLESAWTSARREAPRFAGWLWTYGWVALWGNSLVNAWLMRGGAAGGLVPEPYRPSKLIWTFVTQRLA